jgi:hypothetical protein
MSAGKITLMTRNPIKDRLKAIKEDRYIRLHKNLKICIVKNHFGKTDKTTYSLSL